MALKTISLTAFKAVGQGLAQPRHVAVARDGRVFVAHSRSQLAFIRPDGGAKAFGDLQAEITAMAFDPRGALIVGLSNAKGVGALCRQDLSGGAPVVLFSKVEDRGFRAIHALHFGRSGTLYGVLSSCATWQQAFQAEPKPSGAVFEMKPGVPPRVLARGLHFPKGVLTDEREMEMFVIQSLRGDVVRYEFHDYGGGLKPGVAFGTPLGAVPSEYPADPIEPKQKRRIGLLGGCAMDAERNIWICLPWANKIVAVTPSSTPVVVADDPTGHILKGPTSIAFGGPRLDDIYIGSSEADYVVTAKSPVAGAPLPHQR